VAGRGGVGTVVLDVRRGDGPKECFNYTMAALAATDRLIDRAPDQAAAAIRAIVQTQRALQQDVTLATQVGEKLFPPSEAALIAELIRRDLPFYDAAISRTFVTGMNQFARRMGILQGDVAYDGGVAARFSPMRTACSIEGGDTMGVLIDGQWRDEELPVEYPKDGQFRRVDSRFRDRITADGSSGFKAEPGRYHLYVAHNCPWAHRTLIYRAIKKLDH